MTRRRCVSTFLASLAVAACGTETANIRFRVIAMAEVAGQPVEGSTVMEVRFRGDQYRIRTQLFGEGLILDLKGLGTAFILPTRIFPETGEVGNFHVAALMIFAGIQVGGPGAMTPADFALLRAARGRKKLTDVYPPDRPPLIVAFRDESQPNSIYEVPAADFPKVFGRDVRLVGIDIEIIDPKKESVPVTAVLQQRLKWLSADTPFSGFERDPPGTAKSLKQTPLNRKLMFESFILKGPH